MSFCNNINNHTEKQIRCSVNVVMISELAQRSAIFCLHYNKTHQYKTDQCKAPSKTDRALKPSSLPLISQYDALCRGVDGPNTDIKTISCMQQLRALPQRLAPVSQLFNSSNAG